MDAHFQIFFIFCKILKYKMYYKICELFCLFLIYSIKRGDIQIRATIKS